MKMNKRKQCFGPIQKSDRESKQEKSSPECNFAIKDGITTSLQTIITKSVSILHFPVKYFISLTFPHAYIHFLLLHYLYFLFCFFIS